MGHTSELNYFLDVHRNQLVAAGVPEYLWLNLYHKLVNNIFDAGSSFQILNCEEFEENEPPRVLQAIKQISSSNPQNVFLIDHAWTFYLDSVKSQLQNNENLVSRLCDMFGVKNESNKIETVINQLWRFMNWYSVNNSDEIESKMPCWYVMDEVGSAVWHRDNPNCRIVPFVYANDQMAYSILFPIEDIDEGGILFRDFAEGIKDKERRKAFLMPWNPVAFENITTDPPLPGADYFLSGHIPETLPNLSKMCNIKTSSEILKVYTEYNLIKTYLTCNKFEIVDNEEEADILWYTKNFKDFEELSNIPTKFVNQFPYEYVLTVKDLFAIVCRRSDECKKWVPTSYNLLTELHNFVSYFQSAQQQGLDNFWIVKPYNLARGLDIHISNNLNFIIRQSVTGPKIVQRYITNPVLFYRPECNGKVKFDIRYVILLKSTRPLEVYIYKKFFLRFANKPFELKDFEIYEKHFTVMNYNENVRLKHMKCEEFLVEFEVQYPDQKWDNVEMAIRQMIKDILVSATSTDPPCAIANSPQSRAVYAADIMLEWGQDSDIEPKILEINFMPDCKRACEYYPEFYNDIFKLLFCNENSGEFIML